MLVWSINLFCLSIGLLIVGMIKPNWILFWMDKPRRMPIAFLVAIIFMISATMFGESNRQKQKVNPETKSESSQET